MYANFNEQKVILANGNGVGRLLEFTLTEVTRPLLVQDLTLSNLNASPITTFVADKSSGFAYLTVGACESSELTKIVSIRLVPQLVVVCCYIFWFLVMISVM